MPHPLPPPVGRGRGRSRGCLRHLLMPGEIGLFNSVVIYDLSSFDINLGLSLTILDMNMQRQVFVRVEEKVQAK